jgi:peptide-methionine (R)-S-oxide reductase
MPLERRDFLRHAIALAAVPLALPAILSNAREEAQLEAETINQEIAKLKKPRSEWRKLLSPREYGVLFEDDTERPFSSSLNDEKRQGTFICAACYLPLFDSAAKFDSGTGWPSFFQPITGHIGTRRDFKLIYPRTEYHCIRCDGHQGHVFKDGPPPTGQRWCNNGVALDFVPAGKPLPPLRT